MAFQLDPAKNLSENARKLGARQIDAVLKRLAIKSKQARAVHEARKTMKRLRALLRLIKPALDKKTFRVNEEQLKEIGRSLSGARDIQAMLECIAKLEAAEPDAAKEPVGIALKDHLEIQRREAESELLGRSGSGLQKQLRQVKKAFAGLQIEGVGAEIIFTSIQKDYAAARDAFHHAYEAERDEAFHEWRKLVQRHWRQLLLIEAGWPSMIRQQINIVNELADMLGDDHDLYMLADRIRGADKALGNQKQIDAYLALCRSRQEILRMRAKLLGERLFSEKPASIAARLTAYWRSQPDFAAMFGKEML
jgi:CHAD domain-containing protein